MLEDVIKGQQAGLPPFPTWPPPSGGAPITKPEDGPIVSPFPYGQGQTANINTAPGNAWPAQKATFYPHVMPPLNGGNQNQQLPAWPWPAKMTVLPDKAPPSLSQIP